MKVIKFNARVIRDTREEPTIEISLKTNFGEFVSSAPNGKSRGKSEAKPWKKSLKEDVEFVNNYFLEEIMFKKFEDLKTLENIFSSNVGANTMIVIEYVFLKALAKEQADAQKTADEAIKTEEEFAKTNEEIIVTSSATFVLFIPETNFKKAVEINKRAWENCKEILKNVDSNFKEKTNDENAWQTSLENEQVLEIMKNVRDNMKDEFGVKIHLGIDVAGSSFYNRGKYTYQNPKNNLIKKDQIKLMNKIAKNIFYLEDPLEENDFIGFSKLQSNGLIVGDDLTTTNLERLKIAFLKKSINSIIIKPNQIGSLIEVEKIVDYCKKNKIKMIFSHRSGETSDSILADICFGFQGDFIKTGIKGKGRDEKLNRLIEIERRL